IPGLTLVDASRDDDVVEVCARRLLVAALSRGVDGEDRVRGRVRDDRALVVIECRHRGEATLARYRISGLHTCEAAVIRSPHMDQGARADVVVREVNRRAVRGN